MTEQTANAENGRVPVIRTVGLRKLYTTEEVETTALDNVNLEIAEGEFAAIMGPSGCGKSTLLNLLGLLDNPTEGNTGCWTKRYRPTRSACGRICAKGRSALSFSRSI